jgi:hypothetical protein
MSTVPLGGVLGSLNHLIAAVLEEAAAARAGSRPFALDAVTVDETGCRIAGSLGPPHGRFAMRLEAAPPAGSRQTVRIVVEQWPERLPPLAQWLKPLLDMARIHVDLEFGP